MQINKRFRVAAWVGFALASITAGCVHAETLTLCQKRTGAPRFLTNMKKGCNVKKENTLVMGAEQKGNPESGGYGLKVYDANGQFLGY